MIVGRLVWMGGSWLDLVRSGRGMAEGWSFCGTAEWRDFGLLDCCAVLLTFVLLGVLQISVNVLKYR